MIGAPARFTPPTSESRRPNTNVSVPCWRAGGAPLVGAKDESRLTTTSVSIGTRQARLRRKAVGPIGAVTPVLVRVWSARGPRNDENCCTATRVDEPRNRLCHKGYRQISQPPSGYPLVFPYKEEVGGSNPSTPTHQPPMSKGLVLRLGESRHGPRSGLGRTGARERLRRSCLNRSDHREPSADRVVVFCVLVNRLARMEQGRRRGSAAPTSSSTRAIRGRFSFAQTHLAKADLDFDQWHPCMSGPP